jgi:rhomboid family GlyGly-CTERM serine protease
MTHSHIASLKPWIIWIVLFGLCLALHAAGLNGWLMFDRTAIDQGQWWRLLTGHLVHLNWGHFWLNMGGVLIVAGFLRNHWNAAHWLVLLVWSALAIGLGLYVLNPELYRYVGLSGVLHGLFIAGAWQERKHYALSGTVLLALLVIKLAWEQIGGAMPGSEAAAGGHVIVDAHLYGAVSGAVFVVAVEILKKTQNKTVI